MSRKTPLGATTPESPPSEDRLNDPDYQQYVLGPKALEDMLTRMAAQLQYLWVVNYKNWQVRQGKRPSYTSSPRWDGGIEPKTKRKYPCLWYELAYYVFSKNLEPEALVKSQFEYQGLSAKPKPYDLRSPAGLARYHYYRRSILPKFMQRFEFQKVAARIAVATASTLYPGDPVSMYTSVVADSGLQLSPLFRFCLAMERGLYSAAKYWQQLALEQYLTEPPLYDKVWGEFIPEVLRSQAVALSNSIQLINAKGIGNDRTISCCLLPAEEVWLQNSPYFAEGTS